MLEEKLFDAIDANGESHWVPFNDEAAELACCLEACKQILNLRSIFSDKENSRSYTLLTTPAWNLIEHSLALHKLLGQKDRSSWLEKDAKGFIEIARSLRKKASGPFKKIRNQRSAHNDPRALHPASKTPLASAELVLPPFKEALYILILSLNHGATFAYCRYPDPNKKDEIQVMFEYPLATLMHLDSEGRMDKIIEIRIAADQRHEASSIVQDTIVFYNWLAESTGNHPVIAVTQLEAKEEHEKQFKDGKFQAMLLKLDD
jgi:hypothetical protein